MGANAIVLSLVALASTAAGGLFASAAQRRLDAVLAFSGGVLLGAVLAHLLPESAEGAGVMATLAAAACGFAAIAALRALAAPSASGTLLACALVGHSLIDGAGIGFAFQVSPAVGLGVAAAVIAHDFCDGVNVVGLMLMHRASPARAMRMLALDAAAPLLGALAAGAIALPPQSFALGLGFFGGSLLHIAMHELLPRAFAHKERAGARRMVALAVLGALAAAALGHAAH